MITVHQALRAATGTLETAGVPDPAVDAALLLSFITGRGALELRAWGADALDEERRAAFDALIARRAAREPLQYITGEAPFMGMLLRAAPGALIPRADTEILCQRALLRLTNACALLDLCTGTGALAIALARAYPGARVSAADISPDALAIARANAQANNADVAFYQGDLFAPLGDARFDVIVSNPPYVTRADMASLQPEVRFEPAFALDGGADGLDFYRRIAREAPAHLTPGGWLLLEIGCGQARAVAALLARDFEEITVHQDLRGLDRAVEARARG